jgi:hypothetical protein
VSEYQAKPSPGSVFFVPPTYADFLRGLPFPEAEAFVRKVGRLNTKIARTGDEKADQEMIIARFVDMAATDVELLRKIAGLEFRQKASFSRLAFEFFGRVFCAQTTPGQSGLLESLLPAGLVVKMDFDGRPLSFPSRPSAWLSATPRRAKRRPVLSWLFYAAGIKKACNGWPLEPVSSRQRRGRPACSTRFTSTRRPATLLRSNPWTSESW